MKIYEVLIAFLNERVGIGKTLCIDELEAAFPVDFETLKVYVSRFALSGYLTWVDDDNLVMIEKIPNKPLKVLLNRKIIWVDSDLGHSFGIYKR